MIETKYPSSSSGRNAGGAMLHTHHVRASPPTNTSTAAHRYRRTRRRKER